MRVVIFDLDGTLLDGREGIFWQYEQLTKEYDGVPASRKEIAAEVYGTIDEIVRRLVKNTEVPFEELQKRHEELMIESFKHCQLYDGVGELLPILRQVGVRIAAVTSSSEHTVKLLDTLGIRRHFDIVIAAHQAKQPKPHPEGILTVLEHLSLKPEEAAMVGDTISDIEAGKRANLAKTIAVTHGFGTVGQLKEANPDHIIEDIPSLLDVLDARVGA